jgi:hypothetical protein
MTGWLEEQDDGWRVAKIDPCEAGTCHHPGHGSFPVMCCAHCASPIPASARSDMFCSAACGDRFTAEMIADGGLP